MHQPPQMRASHIKSNVDALAFLGADQEREVRRVAADAVAAVGESSRVGWLPVEVDVELTVAVERVVGRERMRRWARDAIVRSTEGPLLRPVVVGLQAVGFTPLNALKRGPYGWTLIYRGCGDLRYERVSDHEVVLVHDGVPPAMSDRPGYIHGIAGTFEGVAELAGGREVQCFVEPELSASRCCYRCRWR